MLLQAEIIDEQHFFFITANLPREELLNCMIWRKFTEFKKLKSVKALPECGQVFMRWRKSFFLLKTPEQRKAEMQIRARVEPTKDIEQDLMQILDAEQGGIVSREAGDGFQLNGQYYVELDPEKEEISGFYFDTSSKEIHSVILKRRTKGESGALFCSAEKV